MSPLKKFYTIKTHACFTRTSLFIGRKKFQIFAAEKEGSILHKALWIKNITFSFRLPRALCLVVWKLSQVEPRIFVLFIWKNKERVGAGKSFSLSSVRVWSFLPKIYKLFLEWWISGISFTSTNKIQKISPGICCIRPIYICLAFSRAKKFQIWSFPSREVWVSQS